MATFVPDPNRAVRQLLGDWKSAGLTYLEPISPSESDPPPAATAAVSTPSEAASLPHVRPASAGPKKPEVTMTRSTLSRQERESKLQTLAQIVGGCQRCEELAAARTQTVFGVGNPEAAVMFIGEAPGADEDKQGEPFVGRAGQLLTKIIEACGWKREDIYICNILRCRPPGNRNPTPEEARNCREYLDEQIRLVDPDYIVCWGSVAAQNLLDETRPIGKMRETWFHYGRAKVLCTYHPSYMLRNPAAKKPVWEDMKRLLSEMGLEPPET